MKLNYTVVSSIVPVIVLFGCSESYSPASAGAAGTTSPSPTSAVVVEPAALTPDATVREMLALAQDGAWLAYVERFYGEQHKFRPGQNDLEKVAGMLEARAETVIAGLQRAVELAPVMAADGTRAVYDFGEGQQFTLYRAEDGRWMFHL